MSREAQTYTTAKLPNKHALPTRTETRVASNGTLVQIATWTQSTFLIATPTDSTWEVTNGNTTASKRELAHPWQTKHTLLKLETRYVFAGWRSGVFIQFIYLNALLWRNL
ncbi:eb8729d6-8a66-47a5-8774-95946c059f16 [Sclerotinia trifoliorum]|uniref:Eb8729d6-8a66-47a5-8774-95946c059f16 n=1 Tax=Sclerotinia trifoliorum TaxID=28548 RepID=A0A8H2VUJ3_9HELO|nr:eb8729d6-8a66-47a5-8774-95946c059f16 [Sclerotinia trifoliorum]